MDQKTTPLKFIEGEEYVVHTWIFSSTSHLSLSKRFRAYFKPVFTPDGEYGYSSGPNLFRLSVWDCNNLRVQFFFDNSVGSAKLIEYSPGHVVFDLIDAGIDL